MIHLKLFGQSPAGESQAQHGLVVAAIGMAFDSLLAQATRITQQANMREAVIEIDQGHLTDVGYILIPACIHLPDIMRRLFAIRLRLGQLVMRFIRFGQALFSQEPSDAGSTGTLFIRKCLRPCQLSLQGALAPNRDALGANATTWHASLWNSYPVHLPWDVPCGLPTPGVPVCGHDCAICERSMVAIASAGQCAKLIHRFRRFHDLNAIFQGRSGWHCKPPVCTC